MSEGELERDRELVLKEYDDARAALGPVERRLKRFYVACREMGMNATPGLGNATEPRVTQGKLEVGFTQDRYSPEDLLNGRELLALLVERDAACKRVHLAAEAKFDLKIY